jgi:hypothetical protein
MFHFEIKYLQLVLLHALIGALVFAFLPLAKVYGFGMLLVGVIWVVRNQNKNEEVLIVAAYIVGSEVFLRMTGGNPNHEFSKYAVMFLMALGMYLSGYNKNAVPYLIFMVLLVPGVVLGTQVLSSNVDMRKSIIFNISGELCLAVSAIYCYFRPVSMGLIKKILLAMGLPIIACAIYITFYTPDLREVITNTDSNMRTSGGFGPNQVATALGLGMFIFAARMLYDSPTRILFLTNLVITSILAYRGLLTFSRGGMLTGMLMLLILIGITFLKVNSKGRVKILTIISVFIFAFVGAWMYTSVNTGGLIDKRYQNKDALGREKESKLAGREDIAAMEIQAFLDNPFFGMGVAKGSDLRFEQRGEMVASHNELTRLLGEHGFFGIIALMILIFVPMITYLGNKDNIYILPFLIFWLLTLNHAAMRTAAPAFVYALVLLKVQFHEKTTVHRE